MKHRLAGGRRDTDAQNHVTELGNGGIGEDALDVILLRAHERGAETGDAADPSNDLAGVGNDFEDRKNPGKHVNTSRYHRGSVEERRNGRWAFHGIWKPYMEWHLS